MSVRLEIDAELDALCARYPLPEPFALAERFVECASIEGLSIQLVGVVGRAAGFSDALGSAGEDARAPANRAYFELLERTSVLSSLALPKDGYPVFDQRGRLLGSSAREQVFPSDPEHGRWRYSKSNGVALGTSWELACRSARRERVERDRLLRSWYGQVAPERVALPALPALERLGSQYQFEAYVFPRGDSHAEDSLEVVGLFGFPTSEEVALVLGSAAAPSVQAAALSAARELIQRAGFLWGESVPKRAPEFSPTAEYHQEYYLVPNTHAKLRAWLRGEHQRFATELRLELPKAHRTCFVDLTPPHLAGRLHVAKAILGSELELAFGCGHPAIHGPLPEDLNVHPLP